MRKLVVVLAVIFVIPTSAFAWFESSVDTVEVRYPNGQLCQQYQRASCGDTEDMDVKYGFYRSWYENGQLEWEGQYTRDQKTQTWVHWDSTGRRMEDISYGCVGDKYDCVGAKNGMEITWNPNGLLRTALHYRNDKLHGLCTWYTTTHSINEEYNYSIESILAQRFYVDGVMLLPIRGTTDMPYYGEPYHNTENDVWIEWDEGNHNFYIGHQVEGKKHGLWILWTAAGDMERVDVYDHGQQITF